MSLVRVLCLTLLAKGTSRFVDTADKFYRFADQSLYRRRVQVASDAANDAKPAMPAADVAGQVTAFADDIDKLHSASAILSHATGALFGRRSLSTDESNDVAKATAEVNASRQGSSSTVTTSNDEDDEQKTSKRDESLFIASVPVQAPRRRTQRIALQDNDCE